jgi:hypothetical protein
LYRKYNFISSKMASELRFEPDLSWPTKTGPELQFSISIYSLTGIEGCKQYLAASDSRKISKKFDFYFPEIHSSCSVCSLHGCAIWKGYYSRRFVCPKLDYNGRVWIRKGFCKSQKVHFSILPDFCIPYLRWSKFIFSQFLSLKETSFFNAFDWDVAFSTLYWMGALLVKLLRINSHLFLQHPPRTNSVHELKNLSSEVMQKLPLMSEFNWNKQIIPSGTSPPF